MSEYTPLTEPSRLCGADVMRGGEWTGAWCCLPYGHNGDCE